MTNTIWLISVMLTACSGQTKDNTSGNKAKVIGNGCDGCELMYIGIPEHINAVDTSAGWYEKGTRLKVTGRVFRLDGKTPATGVILYYWQTDNNGYYSPEKGQDERVKRHGHIRGWVKTDQNGNYTILTIRPAPYPNDVLPAHIHLSVKEPDLSTEYYTDEINFKGDKFLAPYFKRYLQEKRGGSGVVSVSVQGGVAVAVHNIVLGLNIPNYPQVRSSAPK